MLGEPHLMSRPRLVLLFALASLVLLALFLLVRPRSMLGPEPPEASAEQVLLELPEPPEARTERVSLELPELEDTFPELPAGSTSSPGTVTELPPSAPMPQPHAECQEARDCIGARHPDCDRVRCENGRCLHDRSSCECQSPADCDDGDPCTRDHCFVATAKCIFIPGQCQNEE